MPASFAGSKSLDERRRRRLAQESVDQPVTPTTAQPDAADEATSPAETPSLRRRLDESIIPHAPWKVALFALTILAGWCGTLWVGISPWAARVGLQEVFSLQSGRVTHLFSTSCLILASQLSFFILWHRSRSRKDFGGRYRIWAWAGVFWGITCFVTATKLHTPLAGLAYERWPIECWRAETLFAIGPFAICYLAIHRLLAMEMRTSRVARVLWNLSFVVGALAAGMHLGMEVLVADSSRFLISVALLTGWHAMIAVSLLTHARYVAHINNEATARVVTKRQKLMNWTSSRWGELKEFLRAEESGVVDGERLSATKQKKKVAAPKVTNVKPKQPATTVKPKSTRTRSEESQDQPDTETAKKGRVLGKSIRVDNEGSTSQPHTDAANAAEDDDDDIDYNSLSKKERRRLRKLNKQRSRS